MESEQIESNNAAGVDLCQNNNVKRHFLTPAVAKFIETAYLCSVFVRIHHKSFHRLVV